MTYFKPGDRVTFTEEYKESRPDLVECYKGILIVSEIKCSFDDGYKVFNLIDSPQFLPSLPRIFKLADPIWLKQKDK